MAEPRRRIRLLLNDERIECAEVGPDDMLLDFLRTAMGLCGTKEGCAEGDCGACTVLVGRLRFGALSYGSVNACIRPLATVDGCHVVTVEHLAPAPDALHPVQQAMVECHASQCGFCTPGFVMALHALWLRNPAPAREEVRTALQGNLCRCTGYAPIIESAVRAAALGGREADPVLRARDRVLEQLAGMRDGRRVEVERDGARALLPADVDDLADLVLQETDAVLVAGATDVGVWVNKQLRSIAPAICIGHLDDLAVIDREDEMVSIGAAVTYEDARSVLLEAVPALGDYWDRIGGPQIRTMGTVAGNIANGSPIADLPPVLIALGAEVHLRRGSARRIVQLEDYFLAYGRQDIAAGEFLERVRVRIPQPGVLLGFYKVSKRRDEDIASVCAGISMTVESGTIVRARLAFGGMAEIPARARAAEKACTGGPWTVRTMRAAGAALEEDFTPISDWRAAAGYRAAVARNLLVRFHLENAAQDMPVRLEQVP